MCSDSRFHTNHTRKTHHYRSPVWLELLGRGFQEGHQDRDQQDVVPQGRLKRSVR